MSSLSDKWYGVAIQKYKKTHNETEPGEYMNHVHRDVRVGMNVLRKLAKQNTLIKVNLDDKIFSDAVKDSILPSSPFGKAVLYAYNNLEKRSWNI